MKTKLLIVLVLAATTLLSILFIDRPFAIIVEESLKQHSGFFTSFLSRLETMTAFNVSKYLLAILLLVTGIIFILINKRRPVGYIFLFIGSTHFLSRIIAGTLKNVFNRVRPHQFIEDKSLADFFVDGGSSFPSGHVAHFFSLFLPLVILFPRKTWGLLIIPALVLIQRIIVNDHYLGDTIASLLIVYIITITLQKLFDRFTGTRQHNAAS